MAHDERLVLDSLVAKHLARHGGDLRRSLLAVPAGPELQKALESVADFDVQASVARVAAARTRAEKPLADWNAIEVIKFRLLFVSSLPLRPYV